MSKGLSILLAGFEANHASHVAQPWIPFVGIRCHEYLECYSKMSLWHCVCGTVAVSWRGRTRDNWKYREPSANPSASPRENESVFHKNHRGVSTLSRMKDKSDQQQVLSLAELSSKTARRYGAKVDEGFVVYIHRDRLIPVHCVAERCGEKGAFHSGAVL